MTPTHSSTPAAASAPVEKKVKASTITSGGIVAVILAVLSLVQNDQLLEGLPDWVPLVIGTLIAAGTTFAAGYQAPHTARRAPLDEQRL